MLSSSGDKDVPNTTVPESVPECLGTRLEWLSSMRAGWAGRERDSLRRPQAHSRYSELCVPAVCRRPFNDK